MHENSRESLWYSLPRKGASVLGTGIFGLELLRDVLTISLVGGAINGVKLAGSLQNLGAIQETSVSPAVRGSKLTAEHRLYQLTNTAPRTFAGLSTGYIGLLTTTDSNYSILSQLFDPVTSGVIGLAMMAGSAFNLHATYKDAQSKGLARFR